MSKNGIDLPWFEKYRPKSTKNMVGFDHNIKTLKSFLENFDKKVQMGTLSSKERAVMLEGPPGVGKTTVVYALAHDLGYSVVEMNASDFRTEEQINKKLGDSVSSTNLMAFMEMGDDYKRNMRKKIILIDEVDGISGRSDKGGLSALLKVIDKTKNPIIMTCNFYDTKFKPLYDKADKIKCAVLRKPSIIKILKKIVKNEKLNIDEKSLSMIADNSGGDLRSAINDLQGVAQGIQVLDGKDVETMDMHRDIQEKIFSFLNNLYNEKTLLGAKIIASNTDFDYNLLHKIMYSNLENFVTDSKDISTALMNIAYADVVMGRIKKDMDFSSLPYYFDLVSGGVVLSVDYPNLSGYKRFIFPRYFGSRLKFAEDPVAIELQKCFTVSKHDVIMKILPQIKQLIDKCPKGKSKELMEKISEEFGLSSRDFKKYL